jgi:hypothetical protein
MTILRRLRVAGAAASQISSSPAAQKDPVCGRGWPNQTVSALLQTPTYLLQLKLVLKLLTCFLKRRLVGVSDCGGVRPCKSLLNHGKDGGLLESTCSKMMLTVAIAQCCSELKSPLDREASFLPTSFLGTKRRLDVR